MAKLNHKFSSAITGILFLFTVLAVHHFAGASELKQLQPAQNVNPTNTLQNEERQANPASTVQEHAREESPSDRQHTAKGHSAGHAWSYEGSTGPGHWGELKPEFRIAKEGREQSPIDLHDEISSSDNQPLVINYSPCPLEILNNGHTIQVNVPEGNTLRVGEKEYQLLQFHFHTPSEHTRDGEHYPLEAHFVHKDAEGHLSVVGVFVKKGSRNATLEKIWAHMPATEQGPDVIPDVTIAPGDLLPGDRGYFTYAGSLTTPPCTEGVQWFVLVEPVEASSEQIEKFAKIFHHNNRPTQPLFDRIVRRGP